MASFRTIAWDRRGWRSPSIAPETLEQIVTALEGRASKASVCRTFKVPRSTLIDTLHRMGWRAPTRENG